MEVATDLQEYWGGIETQDAPLEDMLSNAPASFQDMLFENAKLEQALQKISERDRYVLFARILAERSFEELAAELGVGYKGIAAVYYRALQKLKKEMEDDA